MTPRAAAEVVKPGWTTTQFWRPASPMLGWHIPKTAPAQRAPKPPPRCTHPRGRSPDVR
jgi:hypothetical protein